MKRQLLISMLLAIVALTSCENYQDVAVNEPADISECVTRSVNGNINISDPNFSKYILANFDTNKDGGISVEEMLAVTEINCNYSSGQFTDKITTLTGIDFFINLTKLYCNGHEIDNFDVSTLTKLQILDCGGNKITNLNISGCTQLKSFSCNNNLLNKLDLVAFTMLEHLYCAVNKLTTLNVYNNTALKTIVCDKNQLTSINVSKNIALTHLDCSPMTTLNTLIVHADQTISGVTENRNIDKLPTQTKIVYINGNNIYIPDANFKAYLVKEFDTDGDNEISYKEALKIYTINCYMMNISSLQGIEYFTNLDNLICYDNPLTSIDVSQNRKLYVLHCANNQLTSIDVSENAELRALTCFNNQLTNIDVSKNTNLNYLGCFDNQLTILDLRNNTYLYRLHCSPMITLTKIIIKAGHYWMEGSLDKPAHTYFEYIYE